MEGLLKPKHFVYYINQVGKKQIFNNAGEGIIINQINMSMFDSKNKDYEDGGFEIDASDAETIIGSSVKVDGDFVSDGDVLVQGILNGSLKTKGDLRVEKGAKIKADVEATNAKVAGEIEGNVAIQNSLIIDGSAKIEGDIVTKVLSIEPGAVLNGHCSVSARAEKQQIEPSVVQKPSKEDK